MAMLCNVFCRLGLLRLPASVDEAIKAFRPETPDGSINLGEHRGDGWRAGVALILEEARREQFPINGVGIYSIKEEIQSSIKLRCRLEWLLAAHPEIERQTLAPPVVIVGLPRSGSTLLQRLMASDPNAIAAEGWWVGESVPPPSAVIAADTTGSADPIRAWMREALQVAEHKLRVFREGVPAMFYGHPMFTSEADEDAMAQYLLLPGTTRYAVGFFASDRLEAHIRSRSESNTAALAQLRRLLLVRQWLRARLGLPAPTHFVLKYPFYAPALRQLNEVFAGARYVMLHRDPLAVLCSFAALWTNQYKLFHDDLDIHERAVKAERGVRDCVDGMWAFRDFLTANSAASSGATESAGGVPKFIDVRFRDLCADPVSMLRQIYTALGLAFTADTAAAAQHWLKHSPSQQSQNFKLTYSLDQFGYDGDAIRRSYAWLYARAASLIAPETVAATGGPVAHPPVFQLPSSPEGKRKTSATKNLMIAVSAILLAVALWYRWR